MLDPDRLQRQAEATQDTWRDLAPEDRSCAFLEDATGSCRVYDQRPGACRKYHVITDPELSDTVAHPGQEVGRWFSAEAEAVVSAAFTIWPSGTLPAMLLRVLGK